MKPIAKIFWSHAEWFLAAAGLLMAGLIIWFIANGVTALATNLGQALANPSSGSSSQHFDLDGASKLNMKGLSSQ